MAPILDTAASGDACAIDTDALVGSHAAIVAQSGFGNGH